MLRRTDPMRKMIVKREVWAEGVPIPEMIGGAIMGGLFSLVLTYAPDLRGVLDPSSPTLYLIVGTAALIGAALSFKLARTHVVEVKERVEQQDAAARRAA